MDEQKYRNRARIAAACESWLSTLQHWAAEARSEESRAVFERQSRELSVALEDFYRQEDAA